MLVVLVAALVVASSTGALLAQKTTPESTTTTNKQQGSTTTPPNTPQQSSSNNASGAPSPQATTNNCGFQQGTLTGYNIYGPYTYDPAYRNNTDVGANNHSLVYGFFVPQPPQDSAPANFYVCKYDLNTGTETFTGVDLATYSDFGYGLSYLDPPPSGSSYAIHDALLPPLGPIAGTGYYAVYERLNNGVNSGGDWLDSNPHYIYVH